MKKIFLIFYGGAGLYDKKTGLKFVEKYEDIYDWLKLIPELSIMADIDYTIIDKNKDLLSRENIIELLITISENLPKYDGIIILHEVDSIPMLANTIFWQIQSPEKPIIITGANTIEKQSQIIPDMSFKANLINAFQLVESKINRVSVIYGSRVICPTRLKRTELLGLNIFDSVNKKYIARIDFGLSIEDKNHKPKESEYYSKFDRHFVFFKTIPGIKILEQLLEKDNGLNAIIFEAWENQITERGKLIELYKLGQKNNKIIIFYNQVGFAKNFFKHTIVTISNITPECLNAKLSWILGQTKNRTQIREMLKKEIMNEFFENPIDKN
ncbi:MAG: asparaginase domain-containing protein [Patescibacteria group bacterium]|nr:asparaginase domain-containing protein [Patescibacteria group bacterium]